jgi:hypothetical protein
VRTTQYSDVIKEVGKLYAPIRLAREFCIDAQRPFGRPVIRVAL